MLNIELIHTCFMVFMIQASCQAYHVNMNDYKKLTFAIAVILSINSLIIGENSSHLYAKSSMPSMFFRGCSACRYENENKCVIML